MTWARSTAPASTRTRRPNVSRRSPPASATRAASATAATAISRQRSSRRRTSTTPRTITSSTWRRCRAATAAWAAPASRAPWAWSTRADGSGRRSVGAGPLASLLDELGYPSEEGRIEARLARLTGNVFVAEEDGSVVGFAAFHIVFLLERDRALCRLTALVVGEAARRRGLGRALVERVKAEAR